MQLLDLIEIHLMHKGLHIFNKPPTQTVFRGPYVVGYLSVRGTKAIARAISQDPVEIDFHAPDSFDRLDAVFEGVKGI